VNGRALKARLASGELVIGSWITFSDPAVAEIMARAGVDWLTVDMEHSALGIGEAQELIRVITLCGVPALVRLASNDAPLVKRVLDAGAAGIIVPMVNSGAEAEAAVQAAKYPPRGARGVGLARAQGYGPGFAEYVAGADSDTVVVVQIEHVDAVRNLESILAVPGIDAIMIGPYDLSASMGLAGQFERPEVRETLGRIESVARASGLPAGLHIVHPDPEHARAAAARGFRFLAYSVDFLFLGETCRRHLMQLRQQEFEKTV
jgi:2-dehydro-3-deoxyglucarate aldolase